MTLARSFVVLAALAAAVGCGAKANDGATTAGDNEVVGQWSAALTCDGGAAVLDRDHADARHVQFVVREPAIVSYLSSKVNHLQNAKGEVILEGYSDGDPSAPFSRFVDDAGHFDYQQISPTLTKRVVGEVHREDGDRLRLAFSEITTTRTCSGYVEEIYCRNGQWSEKNETRELANWGFQSCR